MKNTHKLLTILLPLAILLCAVCSGGVAAFANGDELDFSGDSADTGNAVSLSVNEDVVSHYYLNAANYANDAQLFYTYNNGATQEKEDVEVGPIDLQSEKNESGYYIINVSQAAAQITEPVTVTVTSESEGSSTSFTYSAKDYCDAVIAMDNAEMLSYTTHPAELKTLCKAIVAYAKSAQGVFDEYMQKDGSVAITDDYSAALGFDSANYTEEGYSKTDGPNVRFRTASFMCESSAKMRFYLAVNNINDGTNYGEPEITMPSGCTYEKGVDTDGSFYIQINQIKPVDFDTRISMSYAGATIQMSVLDYAGKVIGSGATSDALKTLAKSLIRYNQWADAFFGAPATEYVPAKAATCTETGNEACYKLGDKYYEDADATVEIAFPTTPVIAHAYGAYTQTVAPTCTTTGTEVRECTVCGAKDSREVATIAHTYHAVVTAPTCTTGGYTTYTCSACGDTYTGNQTAATGHNYGAWSVTEGATLEATGTETRVCANNANHKETRTVQPFTLKFTHTEDYLYRVGNSGTVKLGQLFDNASGANIASVTADISTLQGNATGSFSANATDWRNSTIQFSNTGVVTVTLKHGANIAATLKLEVVAAKNITAATTISSVATSAVMLNDIATTAAWNISNGTLYGNGFTIDATGTVDATTKNTKISQSLSGAINLSNGTLNNVRVVGPNFKNAAVYQGNVNNVFTVKTSGVCYIYNSYIFGSRCALGLYGASESANLTIENSVIDGGRYSNIFHRFGKLNLHNVTTISQPRTTLNGDVRCGYGIVISDEATANEVITATGYLKQYNWVGKDTNAAHFVGDNNDSTDADTAVSTLFTNMFSKASALTVTYNNQKYINTGILSLSSNAPRATGEAVSGYSGVSVSLLNNSGWVMAPTSLDTSNDFAHYNATTYAPSTQPPTLPTFTWSYPSTYSSTEKQVNLSFESGSSVSLNPNVLTATKYGSNLTVNATMGGSPVSNPITFDTAGDYEIVYTVTDPYNYGADGTTATSRTYTKTLAVHVTETVSTIRAPEFTFYDSSGNSLGSQLVDIGGKHYVMPQNTANTSPTTVSDTNVYAPIITVRTKDNTSDFYYRFPIFEGVTIKNYTDASGTNTTYSKSTNINALPSGLERVTADPNWNGKTSFKTYARDSSYGLYAQSDNIGSTQSARTAVIEYKFTAGNGEAYYYRIYYSAAAHTCPSGCIAEGSLVTMADGTKKPVEDVQRGDMVMTWSFWNGQYEAMPVGIKWYHGTKEWDVLTLRFSDGTQVRTINEHGFFDADKNTYVYIVTDNVDNYVGDRFIKQLPDGTATQVWLDSYSITTENVGCYSLQTVRNDNFLVEDMLTITAEESFPGKFEYFEVGENMKYDEAKMLADIEKYGLFTYEEWSEYLTEEEFYALNGPYYKVLVGKGVLTNDDIINIIMNNLNQ